MMKSLASAMIGAALAAWAASVAAQTKTIVIGYELPLTGDSSHYGEVFRNAADIKLQEFKDAGGMPGANITVRYEDSKNDAKEGRNIAQLFVDDKSIVGVLGDFNTTVSMAAAEIYAKAGMPQLSQTASHPDFVKISKWQFRNITTQAYEGPFNAAWMREKGVSKATVVAIQNDWGLSCASNFVDAFKAKGGTVLSTEYFNPGTRDFRSILTKINRAAPEAMYLCMFYEEGASFLQQRQQLGNHGSSSSAPARCSRTSWSSSPVPPPTGFSCRRISCRPTRTPTSRNSSPNTRRSSASCRTSSPPRPTTRWASCWRRSRRSGPNVTRDTLRDALAETKDYPGVTGVTTFDPVTREPQKTVVRMTIANGEYRGGPVAAFAKDIPSPALREGIGAPASAARISREGQRDMLDIYLVQQIINGLSIGLVYALMAIGFTLIFGVLNVVNFAHGEVYMIGAFAGLMLITSYAPPLLAVVLIVLAVGAVDGRRAGTPGVQAIPAVPR